MKIHSNQYLFLPLNPEELQEDYHSAKFEENYSGARA
jgi:hypothetical protein